MNKQELVNAVAEQAGLSNAEAKRAVDAIFDVIEKSLRQGQKVSLVGFGTFQVRQRAARTGRNPKTGGLIKISSSKTPTLSAGKRLREAVAGGTDDPGPSISPKLKSKS